MYERSHKTGSQRCVCIKIGSEFSSVVQLNRIYELQNGPNNHPLVFNLPPVRGIPTDDDSLYVSDAVRSNYLLNLPEHEFPPDGLMNRKARLSGLLNKKERVVRLLHEYDFIWKFKNLLFPFFRTYI